MIKIQKYDYIEIKTGSKEIVGVFRQGDLTRKVRGFLLDNESHAVRFMPDSVGRWEYTILNTDGASVQEGAFECIENTGKNHGPIYTESYGFRYADGSYYAPIGTTCYAWVHQTPQLIAQTIETLSNSPFNKIRMCVFPKDMPYNNNEPSMFPFEGDAEGGWDVDKPNPEFWSHLEENIGKLRDMGIEADLILFHPYDRWGFSKMSHSDDMKYLDYCIRRLSAFRNIWWSLANEYDLVHSKTEGDWDAFGEKLFEEDMYRHLISIHNWVTLYPKKHWMSHCSVQGGSAKRPMLLRSKYELPIVIDEIGYEGDLEYGWGNLSAFELTCRAWDAVSCGGFITHGETFHREDEVLWWAKGGVLHGTSPKRFQFLKDIQYETGDLSPIDFGIIFNPNNNEPEDSKGGEEDQGAGIMSSIMALTESERDAILVGIAPGMGSNDKYRLHFFGRTCPCMLNTVLPEGESYKIEIIDVWEMTRKTAMESATGSVRVTLPAKEGIAVLMSRLS